MDIDQDTIDDAGAPQDDAYEMLRAFCDNGFEGDAERAALALGREASEIHDMLDGNAEIDGDLAMKIRGIAHERGITVE